MVKYKFKLINSKVPVVRGRNIITDSNVGGIKNTYEVCEHRFITFKLSKGRTYTYWFTRKLLGTKTFLRSYQSVWNKKERWLHAPYWGKGPLLNLWLVLSNDYNDIKDVKVLLPESDTTRHCTKIFNKDFLSQELVKNLKSNQSFYQSNYEKHVERKKR
jgi:hypothetical protein